MFVVTIKKINAFLEYYPSYNGNSRGETGNWDS
jgi:hypothetical protein